MTCILFRSSLDTQHEQEVISKYFHIYTSRMNIIENSLVIARYSCWPFYKELEDDLKYKNSHLINSYSQHLYAADLINYVSDLKELTPETWTDITHVPDIPVILKGETNGKKFQWSSMMFAANKKEAIEVYGKLCNDGLISEQKIYIRKYVPLKTYLIGFQGLPITHEFRIFVAYGQVLSKGYYWSNYYEDLEEKPDPETIPKDFIDEVIKRIGTKINFYAVDVAQTQEGHWIVVEVNDGQQAGLSCNDPKELYSNLKLAIENAQTI